MDLVFSNTSKKTQFLLSIFGLKLSDRLLLQQLEKDKVKIIR